MELTNDATQVNLASNNEVMEKLHQAGILVQPTWKIAQYLEQHPDLVPAGSSPESFSRQLDKEAEAFIRRKEIGAHPKATTPEEEHKKVRSKSELPYEFKGLVKAQQYLVDRGFIPDFDRTQQYQSGNVYHYTNPHTGQRANLSHKNKGDMAKVNYHLVKQPTRRTPEQKRRDNFVLYD